MISVILPVKLPEPFLPTLKKLIHNHLGVLPHEILIQTEKGLGYAVKCGVEKAKGDIIVVMDADGSHPPSELLFMIHKLLCYDVVIGSRYVTDGVNADSFIRRQIAKAYAKMGKVLLGISVRDPMSGFVVARKEVFDDYEFPEGYKFMLPLYASKNLKIGEHPIIFEQRRAGQSKVSTVEGFRTFGLMLKLWWEKNGFKKEENS